MQVCTISASKFCYTYVLLKLVVSSPCTNYIILSFHENNNMDMVCMITCQTCKRAWTKHYPMSVLLLLTLAFTTHVLNFIHLCTTTRKTIKWFAPTIL